MTTGQKKGIRVDPFNKTVIVWPIEPVNIHQTMEKNIWQITICARHFQRGAALGASPGDFKRPPPDLRYYNKENKAVWNLYGKF